jgi:chemotaxis-related protein WspB
MTPPAGQRSMVVLTCSAGTTRYGVDTREVIVVVPLPPLHAADPTTGAGMVRFRGTLIPVVDLCHLQTGQPAARLLSTRMIVVRYPARPQDERPLGVVAERVLDVADVDVPVPATVPAAGATTPWIGPLVADRSGALIQMLRVEGLLADALREVLFPTVPASPDARP